MCKLKHKNTTLSLLVVDVVGLVEGLQRQLNRLLIQNLHMFYSMLHTKTHRTISGIIELKDKSTTTTTTVANVCFVCRVCSQVRIAMDLTRAPFAIMCNLLLCIRARVHTRLVERAREHDDDDASLHATTLHKCCLACLPCLLAFACARGSLLTRSSAPKPHQAVGYAQAQDLRLNGQCCRLRIGRGCQIS